MGDILITMVDGGDNVFDRAETLARRILERLGTSVDSKLTKGEDTLQARVIGDLASKLESVVEANLQEDERGIRRIAPNQFKILFTYEETSRLTPQYIESVGNELTAALFEYINNRRYFTRGTVIVEAVQDLFATTTQIKASFSSDSTPRPGGSPVKAQPSKIVRFLSSDGHSYQVQLISNRAPAHVGRVAGSALRLDDPSVSRMHCSLSVRPDGNVVVADLGSANGTFINEVPLKPDEARILNQGDVISVGDFKLTVTEIT
jgi:FHA domain/FhaA, N-terminal domain